MPRLVPFLCVLLLSLGAFERVSAAAEDSFDVVVYDSTPGGVMAAVAAARHGAKTAMLAATTHIGGICSSGLGQTDKGDPSVIGGLALEFFSRNAKYYGQQGALWNLEPHVALHIFETMLSEAGVKIFTNATIKSLQKSGTTFSSLTTVDGRTFQAKVFVDGSYEGDLIGLGGLSYHVGRESSQMYNETLNGFRGKAKGHEFTAFVDPYDANKNLLPLVMPFPNEAVGDGDKKVQAYNFRLCVTQNKTNMIPFIEPASYKSENWELARRYFAVNKPTRVPSCNTSPVPNGKYDMNNCGAISSDMIGASWEWPEATVEKRQEIYESHKNYTKELLWFLSSDPSLPDSVHQGMATWGLCADEFKANDNWPPQLYVREGRRMIGDKVFTSTAVDEQRGNDIGNASIGMGSYNYDAHNAIRYACTDKDACSQWPNGTYVWNDGDVEVNPGYHYQIPYYVLLPKMSEATNVLAPLPASASHIGYATLRMEPQFMIMGHSAGAAAALAAQEGVAVQNIDLNRLAVMLKADNQTLRQQPPSPPSPPSPPPPPGPPSTCSFEANIDYDHENIMWAAKTEQECCNMCANTKGCVYAIFRSSGPTASTCWPGKDLTGKRTTAGVSACIVQK